MQFLQGHFGRNGRLDSFPQIPVIELVRVNGTALATNWSKHSKQLQKDSQPQGTGVGIPNRGSILATKTLPPFHHPLTPWLAIVGQGSLTGAKG